MKDVLNSALAELNFPVAEALLKAGADINVVNEQGESLLYEIIKLIHDHRERLTFMRFMLEHGANPCLPGAAGAAEGFAGFEDFGHAGGFGVVSVQQLMLAENQCDHGPTHWIICQLG